MFSFKKHGYTYLILLALRILISFHVGYRYISYSSTQDQGKGGTFVEATFHKINYLPYFANNDEDIFYQSFFFNGCIYPSFSGTTINYREELCSVDTLDYKTFTVTPKPDTYRSDGKAVTLNDIYFTYNTLLKENYRNRSFLDSYKNITVIANENDGNLQVIFPKASIDNMIFFTNFILPSHLLANKSLETYFTTFYKQPIGTNCATLQSSQYDENSTIFDLSTCHDVPLKFYQVKQFNNTTELQTYINKNPDIIDLIIDKGPYPGYTLNQVILNKFATLFFNTEKVAPYLRKKIGSALATHIYNAHLDTYLIKDNFLFDTFASGTTLQKEDFGKITFPQQEKNTSPSFVSLPDTLTWNDETRNQEYSLRTKINDKKILKLKFDKAYDKISVTLDKGKEYFPSSYDPKTKSSFYNLNPIYRNIHKGLNTYTIKAYTNGEKVDEYTLMIHYLQTSKKNTTNNDSLENQEDDDSLGGDQYDSLGGDQIHIIYFNDETSKAIVDTMKTLFKKWNVGDFFEFTAFDDANIFAGKLQSKGYDIVIRSISMGLRKDISNLFLSSLPEINPSLYTSDELSLAINEYFLAKDKVTKQQEIKTKINTIYSENMPFLIFGKELGSIYINNTKIQKFTYPFRLYVLGRRKDFIKDLPVFQHFSIDRDHLKSFDNFKKFLSNKR